MNAEQAGRAARFAFIPIAVYLTLLRSLSERWQAALVVTREGASPARPS